MRDFQALVCGIVVNDKRQPIGTDGDRGELANISFASQGGDVGRSTNDIVAMGDFQVPVRRIIVADQASTIGPDRDGGKLPDLPRLTHDASP